MPFVASALAAYSALRNNDKELAQVVWRILLRSKQEWWNESENARLPELFQEQIFAVNEEQDKFSEILRISTNFASQWSLLRNIFLKT